MWTVVERDPSQTYAKFRLPSVNCLDPVRNVLRPLLLLTIVLMVPIVPFLVWGQQLEPWITHWAADSTDRLPLAMGVFGLLSTDVLLPIPSSFLSTLGGARLGWWLGTLVSWGGMTLGACVGFGVARRWGRPLALRLSRAEDLAAMDSAVAEWGIAVLVLARAVPVVAEASVLLVGVNGWSWRRFLPPVLASNLGIALAYSAFGEWASRHAWLPLALGVSVALPILIAAAYRQFGRPAPSVPDGEQGP